MENEKINEVIKELIKRAHESFQKYGTCAQLDREFKCPKCGRLFLEYTSEKGLRCLWQDCQFRINAPTIKEMNEFFTCQVKKRKNELINKFFQEIKGNISSWDWKDVFKFI